MHPLFKFAIVLAVLMHTVAAGADENPFTDHNKHVYRGVKAILLSAAEKMPEEKYGFRPVESVRTYGQIVGHVADAQYFFCSKIRGEKNPGLAIEKNKTSKADLIAALEDSFAYCDAAYEGMTDASGSVQVKVTGSPAPKLGALYVNQTHAIEHYGNMITYLRINGIVPPTSDPEFMKSLSSN